jgi:N6-L-threonylcarbamoyladenine synthase
MLTLGIESSCDETAAAVVKNGIHILSTVVSSQVSIHHSYGGVVPELASRKHVEAIVPVVNEALAQAGVGFDQINGIAVTRGPGLVGSLLVGFSFAKACSYALGIPWIGVDHLEGHIHSIFLEPDPPPYPFISLLVSGGHTGIYHVTAFGKSILLGRTRDDAAGEAYDKVAKMLGLGYPGGLVIDRLARQGNPKKIRFPRAQVKKNEFDFSFSGLKTAVNRYLQTHSAEGQSRIYDIAAGFQEAVADVLVRKTIRAAGAKSCTHISIVGGVAANSRLREKLLKEATANGFQAHLPSPSLCGDNAAMIAAVGHHYLKNGLSDSLDQDVYSRSASPVAV